MKIPALIPKLLANQFRWVVVSVVVVVLGLGYFLLIANKIQTIQTAGLLERQKVQNDLADKQQFLKALQDSIQKYDQVLPAERVEALNEFIPSQPDFPGLVLTLNNIASAANLSLASINVSSADEISAAGQTASAQTAGTAGATARAATVSGVNLQVQDVTIAVAGGQSYENFKNFIGIIESSQRLFDVISLSFALGSSTATPAANASSYSLHLRTYYLPETK